MSGGYIDITNEESKIADKIDYEHIIAESELEFEEMMKDDK